MTEITTSAFLNKGRVEQFTHVLSLYSEALQIKAETKNKPQELIKLDNWYQTVLPKILKSRNPTHLTHEELINLIRWKQARGKFRPKLKELVTMNSPRCVVTESKKAFRALEKKGDLSLSVAYLCNLKGIGPSTASAILTAYAPDVAAFMADECLAAVPEIEGIDYTTKEYLDLMRHLREVCGRLTTPTKTWTPHEVEKALWTHYTLLMLKPELLQSCPKIEILNGDIEDSNSLDSRGFTDEEISNTETVVNGQTKSLKREHTDVDDESSLPTTEEHNSNSSTFSKSEESSDVELPKLYTNQHDIPVDKESQLKLADCADESANSELTGLNYCNSKIHNDHETIEPDKKRVKVE